MRFGRSSSHVHDLMCLRSMGLFIHGTSPTAKKLATLPVLEEDNKNPGVYLCIL